MNTRHRICTVILASVLCIPAAAMPPRLPLGGFNFFNFKIGVPAILVFVSIYRWRNWQIAQPLLQGMPNARLPVEMPERPQDVRIPSLIDPLVDYDNHGPDALIRRVDIAPPGTYITRVEIQFGTGGRERFRQALQEQFNNSPSLDPNVESRRQWLLRSYGESDSVIIIFSNNDLQCLINALISIDGAFYHYLLSKND